MARTILHTGADAVTTAAVAAATALRCAGAGDRTLLLSTGPDHHVGDLLGRQLGPEPVAVGPQLWAAEVAARAALAERSPALGEWLAARPLPPGLDGLAAGLALTRHATDAWDVVVVACGAPAELLRLLALPDAARGWLARLAPADAATLDAVPPWLGGVLPGEGALAEAGRAASARAALDDVLTDPERCSARLVLGAATAARAAGRRTAAALALHGIALDAVVVLAPDAAPHAAAFAPVPVLAAPAPDLDGETALADLGAALWAVAAPAEVLHAHPAHRLVVGRDGASLQLPLPHTDRAALALHRVGDALVVSLGEHRRRVVLPPAVADYRPAGARFVDGVLHVDLRPPAP
jgi:arsenite/tail-anchored protein-transporting ATPase